MANYSVGDTVGVRIHKVDRTNTSKKLLPCKILEETSTRDRFRVYSKDGILATTFAHTDLIDFRNVKFDDLETIVIRTKCLAGYWKYKHRYYTI